MKKVLIHFIILFTAFFTYSTGAQEIGVLRKRITINFPEKIQKLVLDSLPAGTYSVGTGGYFPTIDSAFNKLSIDGIAGEVILELIDDLYTAPTSDYGFQLIGPIPGAGPNSRVTIKPIANKNVTIEGSSLAVINFLNTSYITIDGTSLTGNTTLTIHSFRNTLYNWNDGIDFIDNSDHNVIQNIIFICDDFIRCGYTLEFYGVTGSSTPDSNLIQNNFVKKAGVGLGIYTVTASARATGNIIRGNMVGSETDSLIFWGISADGAKNTIIENNIVQHMRQISTASDVTKGINSYYGNGDIIRNNVVHNIKSYGMSGCSGICVGGDVGKYGNNNIVYNNMVYDVGGSSTSYGSFVCGIQLKYQNNPNIFYNSVYMSGMGANRQGSASLYIYTNCTNVVVKNNILVNTRNESPYCASAIYSYAISLFPSDYNDLYYEPNQYNCLVRIGSTKYNTLSNWQTTGRDLNSVTEMPNFITPDLHISESIPTLLESGATPIAGIVTDFDGDSRDATTPDIGADEFNGIVNGIEDEITLPTKFLLFQNYPNPFNPLTTINYELPVTGHVELSIYNLLGQKVATLVSTQQPAGRYNVQWDATGFASGIYLYKLETEKGYSQTKKLVLLK